MEDGSQGRMVKCERNQENRQDVYKRQIHNGVRTYISSMMAAKISPFVLKYPQYNGLIN